MDSILVVVADKLGIYERVAEEIIGNMGKSEARRNADSEPSTPRQTLLFATKHHFAETTYVGKCKVVKRKPKEPDMFAPKRDAKEVRWWRIVPISVRDRSTIQQLQWHTKKHNKILLPVTMLLKEQPSSKQGPSPKKQNKLPPATLPLECQLSRPKPPWVKGLIDKDSTYQKYQKRFGFLPTIWSAADPDKRATSKYAGCPSTSCQNSTSNKGGAERPIPSQ